jgi:hypothetical protein
MKTKDYLIVALLPLLILMIPLVAMQFTREVKWTLSDFVIMWFVLTIPTFLFRLLVTRTFANLSYRLGAGLAVVTGFFMTWVNLAVQIIGHDNAANMLYFGVALLGLAGVGLSRFRAEGLARTAFAAAVATFLVPVIGWLGWPGDFSPGVFRVFVLNGFFVAMFTFSGLLFRHSAGQTREAGEARAA